MRVLRRRRWRYEYEALQLAPTEIYAKRFHVLALLDLKAHIAGSGEVLI